MIVDKTRRELITARAAAGDRIAGFQLPLRFREMIELAFSKDDHRDGRLSAVTQNQRDRNAFDVAQPRAAGSEPRLRRPVVKSRRVEPAAELLCNLGRHRAAELRRGDLMNISAVAFLDCVRKIERPRSRDENGARSNDERRCQRKWPKYFDLRKRPRRDQCFDLFPKGARHLAVSQKSTEPLVEFFLCLKQTCTFRARFEMLFDFKTVFGVQLGIEIEAHKFSDFRALHKHDRLRARKMASRIF